MILLLAACSDPPPADLEELLPGCVETHTWDDLAGAFTQYLYDEQARIREYNHGYLEWYATSEVYQRDADGCVVRDEVVVSDGEEEVGASTHVFTCDAHGNAVHEDVTAEEYAHTVDYDRSYDDAGNPTEMHATETWDTRTGDTWSEAWSWESGRVVDDVQVDTYGRETEVQSDYDDAGRLADERTWADGEPWYADHYAYDELDRVATIERDAGIDGTTDTVAAVSYYEDTPLAVKRAWTDADGASDLTEWIRYTCPR
jgi:hypothetical protein